MSGRWHYTTGHHLPRIARDGFLKLSTGLIIDPGERPALWFSEQSFWEPTVQAIAGLARSIACFGYVARIAVAPEVCPISWREFKRTSGISSRTARKLEKSRKYGGHPELWWVSYQPVPRDLWLSVEILDSLDGAWRPAQARGVA